jgi:hypothetical protein
MMSTKSVLCILAIIFFVTSCMAQPPNVDPLPDSSGPYGPGISISYSSNQPNYNQPNYNQPNYNQPNPAGSYESYNQPSTTDAPPLSSPPSYDPAASGDTFATSLPQGEVSRQQVTASASYNAQLVVVPYTLTTWVYYMGAWTTDPAGAYLNRRMSSVIYNPVNQNIHIYEKYYNSGRVNYRNWGYHYGETYIHAVFIADEPGWHELAVKGSQTGWSNVLWIKVY